MFSMQRAYGAISLASLALALWLILASVPVFGRAPLTALGAPGPGPTPVACAGVVLSGGVTGCLSLTQIVCRESAGSITAQGLLGGATSASLLVKADQVTLAITDGDVRTSYLGPGPREFDLSRGARLDDEYGDLRGPGHVHLSGWVSCGF